MCAGALQYNVQVAAKTIICLLGVFLIGELYESNSGVFFSVARGELAHSIPRNLRNGKVNSKINRSQAIPSQMYIVT